MPDVFTLTIRKPAGSRLFGETREAERQRIAQLLADVASIIGSHRPLSRSAWKAWKSAPTVLVPLPSTASDHDRPYRRTRR